MKVDAKFVITAKGPELHREYKGEATINSEKTASASELLYAMLHQIITRDGLRGDTSISAKFTIKTPRTKPQP